ncbi:MAG: carboxypeptidase-like regulatory domain-containing protein [Acidobacteriia bacterium]|nr:carboxypeptidase-like regulatory domain-containing protein [Terriglobia bacterium]
MISPCLCVTLNRLIFLFLLAAIAAPWALGQASYTAQVRGVVTDQSGAVVPNATLTITNDATNISMTARSDDH